MALDSFEPADATVKMLVADLTVEPLGPVLGAEVSGLRLQGGLDPEQATALRSLLLRYKVLVFRDLDLSHEEHLALGRVWGELEGHPVIAHLPGFPEILTSAAPTAGWRTRLPTGASGASTSGMPT